MRLTKTQKGCLRWFLTRDPRDLPENAGIATDRVLARLGLIDHVDGRWVITEAGRAIAEKL